MKRLALLYLSIALLAGCQYTKPGMYVNINNSSGQTIRNIEVNYPGGIYGMAMLPDQYTNRRLIALTPPCKFTISFDNNANQKAVAAKPFDFGDQCPKEITFLVGNGFEISGKVTKK